MSTETLEWLQNNVLVGFTDKRPNGAWHKVSDGMGGYKGHFPGPVPIEQVRELLSIPLAEADVSATYLTLDGVTTIGAPAMKAIVRTDTADVFYVGSQRFQIHDPAVWCLDNLDIILDGGLQVATAGLLKGGRRAWMQAELSETRIAAEGIAHRPYITAATGHDGSLATTYLTGSTVVVCDNTMSAALQGAASTVKIRHSSKSLTRVGEVRANLGLVVEQVGDAFDEQVRALTSRHVSDSTWREFVKAYSGIATAVEGRSKTMAENKATSLERLWKHDERVAPWANSAYGVVTAVNTYVHHEATVKGAERTERNFDRMVEGAFDELDAATLRLLDRV